MMAKEKRKKYEKRTTTGSMSPELLRDVRVVGAHLGLGNAEVLDRFALPTISKLRRRLESGKHIENGEAGA